MVSTFILSTFTPSAFADEISKNRNKDNIQNSNDFYKPAFKYVEILEERYLTGKDEFTAIPGFKKLLNMIKTEGQSEHLIEAMVKLNNASRTKIATQIGIRVVDFPLFYDYFNTNIQELITKNSPLYESMIAKKQGDYAIQNTEVIVVTCTGDYCNNPNDWLLQLWIGVDAGLNANINISDTFEARVVNANGEPYPNTNPSYWRYNGSADVDYLPVKPCETCEHQ